MVILSQHILRSLTTGGPEVALTILKLRTYNDDDISPLAHGPGEGDLDQHEPSFLCSGGNGTLSHCLARITSVQGIVYVEIFAGF